MLIYYQQFDSPMGNLSAAADDEKLRAVVYGHKIDGYNKVFPAAIDQENEIIATTKKQLGEYFKRRRERFDLTLFFNGYLAFFYCISGFSTQRFVISSGSALAESRYFGTYLMTADQ